MPHKTVGVLGFAVATALLAIAAFAASTKVEHDDPMRLLDARYHDLPEALVAQLQAQAPPRPYVFINEWCFTYKRTWHKDVDYCVCYNDEGCRELKRFKCGAKLGAIAPGIGVCRMYESDEHVVVTG